MPDKCPIVEITNEDDVDKGLDFIRNGLRVGIRIAIDVNRDEMFRLLDSFHTRAADIRDELNECEKFAKAA